MKYQALSCALDLAHDKVKFKFWKTTSDGETAKMKVVDLKKLWNFVFDNFLFEFV